MENLASIEEMFAFFYRDNAEILTVLQQCGLIRTNLRCVKRNCRRQCVWVPRPLAPLGPKFGCRKCKCYYSVLKGSFFEEMRIPVKTVIHLLYFWSCLTPASVVARLMNLRYGTVCQQFRVFRDIASWKLLRVPELFYLGGVGHVVQIDESVVTKRKYNVGRIIPQVWVLGMVDVTTKRGVVVYIRNRSREVILDTITQYVLPGTEIWTDCWRAYDSLHILGGVSPYTHKSVNHSRNFVDPTTGVNTNRIEGYWAKLKGFCRRNHVLHSQYLSEHIDHFMWFEIYGGSSGETFTNIIGHISEKYTF